MRIWGQMRLKQSYHSFAALYVTGSSTAKKAPRRIEALFTNYLDACRTTSPFWQPSCQLSSSFSPLDLLLSFVAQNSLWRDRDKRAIPSLAPLLRMSNVSVKKNPDYFAPGLIAKAIYCGAPP
ncbi:MAG TPA: hypothetical protein VGF61_08205 [Candidatus Acidoferrum sp.]|jgi:hypothetical protein